MNIWRKFAAGGAICLPISFALFVVGVMMTDTLSLVIAAIALSFVGPILLMVGLIGSIVARSRVKA
jgi:hypothetical protein